VKKIIFRVDSGLHIGVGHVMRCLTLARALKDKFDVTFICKNHLGHISELIKKEFSLHLLSEGIQKSLSAKDSTDYVKWIGDGLAQDLQDTNDFVHKNGCDLFVVDHYAIDATYEEKIQSHVVMVIDDLFNRTHFCDLLLDQNITAKKEKYNSLMKKTPKLLMGTSFALLRAEFQELRKQVDPSLFNRPIRKIVVFFGGTDSKGLTLKMAKAISGHLEKYEFHFVLDDKHVDHNELQTLLSHKKNCSLHSFVENFAQLMLSADLFIGAGGTTSWERATLGIASAVVAVAENQMGNCLELQRTENSYFLGKAEEIDQDVWDSFFSKIVPDQTLWYRYRKNSFDLTDGRGTDRVVEEIEKVLC
jgi:UDP-2,4-diacetamido-2,4,6-trideoxy-beta-L-altropyranose hydrolase